MSKVKSFFDTKSKSKHRMRRQETRSKKLSRIRKGRNNVYRWYKGGYYSDDENVVHGHGFLNRFGHTNVLKDCKRTTARALRRNALLDEENYMLPVRSAYKKTYGLERLLL